MEPQIRLLGGNELCDAAGRSVRLPTRKCWALLAYLAMIGGRDVPREELAALFWPRSGDRQARASLRQELAVLRKVMNDAGLPEIDSTKEVVRLDLSDGTVDARQMDQLIVDGNIEDLRRAVTLYGGEFLSGLNIASHAFEDWQWVERQRLKALAQTACLQLLDHDLAGSNTERAMTTATCLLEIEAAQEQGHRALMRLYLGDGRRTDALRQYRRCIETLRRELDAEPSQETVALAARIRSDLTGPARNGKKSAQSEDARALYGQVLQAPELDEIHTLVLMAAILATAAEQGKGADPGDFAMAQDTMLRRYAHHIAPHGARLVHGPGGLVLACFGYPEHGDRDLELAVRAARALVAERVALSPHVFLRPRVGIARGKVLIRAHPAGDGPADLAGDAVRQVLDLMRAAKGGEVVISADIRNRIDPAVDSAEINWAQIGETATPDRGYLLKHS